jgi:hypothetical protein
MHGGQRRDILGSDTGSGLTAYTQRESSMGNTPVVSDDVLWGSGDTVEATSKQRSTAWSSFFMVVLIGVPNVCATIGLSGIGWGAQIFNYLLEYSDSSNNVLFGSAGLLMLMYLADFSYWTGCWWKFRRFLLLLVVLGGVVGACLTIRKYPAAPFAIEVLFIPAYLYCARVLFFAELATPSFLKSACFTVLASSIVVLGIWITWVFGFYYWEESHFWPGDPVTGVKAEFEGKIGCNSTAFGPVDVIDVNDVDQCFGAYLLWMSPSVVAIAGVIFSSVTFLLGNSFEDKVGACRRETDGGRG